jgi:hypothetical protein
MRSRVVLSLLVVTAALSMTSCVDEQIVFRDRPIFLEPDPTALEFLGYANPERNDKLTVCGQCHVGQQTTWQATGHAFAWAGLQQSDHAQAFCEACHTVNSLGNVAGPDGQAVGGWVAVNDARYHDVQCESCHGPGLPHVRNPSAEAAHPQAPITVASGDMTFGCAQCHSGFHHPFVDEWSESAHGNVTSYAATRRDNAGGCWSCHSGEGALQKFGVRSNYLEKAALVDRNEGFAHITCAVCHDPHSNEYEGQLRFPSNTGNIDTHICAQCHNRATVPGVGPRGLSVHSPEAPLLDGVLHTVGWIPPGMEHDVDQIRGSHAGEGNPSLCTTCHMVPFETFDPQANRTFFATGHSFDAIPCVDANGIPTGGTNCPLTVTARDWRGCTNGCHGSETAAVSVTNSALTLNLSLVRDLYNMLRQIDPNLSGPGGPIDPTTAQFTVAEGAYFNLQLTHHGTPLHQDGFNVTRADSLAALAPSTVHNPFLIRSLLVWSIEAVRSEYGVSPSASFDPVSLLEGIPFE